MVSYYFSIDPQASAYITPEDCTMEYSSKVFLYLTTVSVSNSQLINLYLCNYESYMAIMSKVAEIQICIKIFEIVKFTRFLAKILRVLNGLQVNVGLWNCEFAKSLIFCNFDDVLKQPFRYVHLVSITYIIIKNRHA